MNTNLNSSGNFNELVFENKNKAYGAYAIRKSYHDHVTISLIVSSAFFGILALLAILYTNRKIDIPNVVDVNTPVILTSIIRDVIIPEPIKKIEKVIKNVDTAPKTISGQLSASDNKKDFLDKTNDQNLISKNPNPKGSDSTTNKDPEIKLPVIITPTKVELYAQQMPQMDNMAQFIVDNLRYPRTAIENGTKGVVFVTFVVELDGSITDIKLLRGIGDGCEQEAMRVISLMPKWKPGMNNGKAVRVQCNLPVSFKLQ